MKETIYQVAAIVTEAVPKYRREGLTVVGRLHGSFDDRIESYWLHVGSLNRSMLSFPHLKHYGRLIPRNSGIATRILNNEIGEDIEFPGVDYLNRPVKHHIKASSKADFPNHRIYLMGDSQVYTYDNIEDFLKGLRQNQQQIEQQEQEIKRRELEIKELQRQADTAHKRGVLTKGLQKMKEVMRVLTMQQEEMSQFTRFIHKQGQLRFNPILDPVQNRIKTQNLFNGTTIVIDGGPGTGKTTTMIQRLKYLTDWDAIEEDFTNGTNFYQLTPAQRDHLHQAILNHRDWMFFSPSELLKEYLSDAMNREGLTNTSAKVRHWAEYRNKVIRENYLLIDPTDDNAPFKASRSREMLFRHAPAVIESFATYYLDQLRLIKSRFPKIEMSGALYRWMSITQGIQQRFEGCENFTLQQFVQLFNSLEQLYRDDCRELLSENRERVRNIANEIFVLSQDDATLYEQLVTLARTQMTEQTEDTEDEAEVIEGNEMQEDVDNRILLMLRTWFKRYCYSRKNYEIRLTSRQEQLSKLLMPILTDEHEGQMDRVGELALFEQYAKYTRGIVSNLFGGFAAKYKRFRRQALSNKDDAWNLVELDTLLKRREGKELHPQEQSLLIGFINNLVKMVLRTSRASINHTFITAYRDLSRPIIGIDEATDFDECDIYAIQSLLYNDYNSLTICGDLMQRLTKSGIRSWESVRPFVEGMKLVDMRTSYRQSATLLKVAQMMYKDTIGDEPNYKAYMKSSKVPCPLAYISTDEDDKIDWIEKRLNEVYVAYGKKLPSIAIFLNNKNEIRSFVDALRDTDFIIDAGIEVVDGSEGNILASGNQIRVYPIDVVKGMEFDVVFFHNIDQTSVDNDLIKRYIYVGVSRAAFFLGITLNADNSDITKYFTKGATWTIV